MNHRQHRRSTSKKRNIPKDEFSVRLKKKQAKFQAKNSKLLTFKEIYEKILNIENGSNMQVNPGDFFVFGDDVLWSLSTKIPDVERVKRVLTFTHYVLSRYTIKLGKLLEQKSLPDDPCLNSTNDYVQRIPSSYFRVAREYRKKNELIKTLKGLKLSKDELQYQEKIRNLKLSFVSYISTKTVSFINVHDNTLITAPSEKINLTATTSMYDFNRNLEIFSDNLRIFRA